MFNVLRIIKTYAKHHNLNPQSKCINHTINKITANELNSSNVKQPSKHNPLTSGAHTQPYIRQTNGTCICYEVTPYERAIVLILNSKCFMKYRDVLRMCIIIRNCSLFTYNTAYYMHMYMHASVAGLGGQGYSPSPKVYTSLYIDIQMC